MKYQIDIMVDEATNEPYEQLTIPFDEDSVSDNAEYNLDTYNPDSEK